MAPNAMICLPLSRFRPCLRTTSIVLYLLLFSQSLSLVLTLLQPHGLQLARLLCPWDFPGKNTGVGCHLLLQGIFSTKGLNPSVVHGQVHSLPLSHMGNLIYLTFSLKQLTGDSLFKTACSSEIF